MSLDNSLRAGLLRVGEGIPVDVETGLAELSGRIGSMRRRRAMVAVATAAAVAGAVWLVPQLAAPRVEHHLPPAEDELEKKDGRPPVERKEGPPQDGPSRRDDPTAPRTDPGGPSRRVGVAPQFDESSAPRPNVVTSEPRSAGGTSVPAPPAARVVHERYDVRYVADAHISENVGTGCSEGDGTTGSNDCFALRVGSDENRLELRLVDVSGVSVGARVTEYVGNDTRSLGSFCGGTGAPLEVTPGAMVLVYIDTTDRCSEKKPTTGRLTARFSTR